MYVCMYVCMYAFTACFQPIWWDFDPLDARGSIDGYLAIGNFCGGSLVFITSFILFIFLSYKIFSFFYDAQSTFHLDRKNGFLFAVPLFPISSYCWLPLRSL